MQLDYKNIIIKHYALSMSGSENPYSSHVKAGKHACTVYNFKRKSRIRKSLTRLLILLEFIHKYIF